MSLAYCAKHRGDVLYNRIPANKRIIALNPIDPGNNPYPVDPIKTPDTLTRLSPLNLLTGSIDSSLFSSHPTMVDDEPFIRFAAADRLDETGSNFCGWIIATEIALAARGLLEVTKGDNTVSPAEHEPRGNAREIKEWKRRDALARAQIAMNVSMDLLGQLDTSSACRLFRDIQARFEYQLAIAHRRQSLGRRDLRTTRR